jgi:hypothetical protein
MQPNFLGVFRFLLSMIVDSGLPILIYSNGRISYNVFKQLKYFGEFVVFTVVQV